MSANRKYCVYNNRDNAGVFQSVDLQNLSTV